MAKKTKKKKGIVIGSIIGILLLTILIIGILISYNTTTSTSYFYDGKLGIITTEITVKSGIAKFFNLFEQAVTFAAITAETGDTVSFTDTFTVPVLSIPDTSGYGCYIDLATVWIKRNGEIVTSIDVSPSPPASWTNIITKSSTLTSNSEGVISARTQYSEALCYIDIIEGPINCVGSTECSHDSWWDDGTNNVEFTNPVTTCPSDTTSQWEHDKDITGGYIESRVETTYGSPPNCNVDTDTQYQTFCDEGYHLIDTADGTNGPAPGELSCVIDSGNEEECETDDDCNEGQVCNEATNECEAEDCNANEIHECDDGTNITVRECVDGVWGEATGNKCPTIDDTNQTTYWRLTSGNCSSISLLPSAKTSNDYTTEALCLAKITLPGEIICWEIKTASDGTESCSYIKYQKSEYEECPLYTYKSKDKCEDIIESEKKSNVWTIVTISGIGVALLIGIIIFINNVILKRGRRK